MSNRIKELAEQVDKEFDNPGARHNAIERFAELIVKECADVYSKNITVNRPLYPTEFSTLLRKHFGVE